MYKLEKKAYKCIFPSMFDYGKDPFSELKDCKEYVVSYGKNQKEAVKEICQNDENYPYWEMKKAIRTRRYKDGDLYSQYESELLRTIDKDIVSHLTHSLGVYVGDICPENFYRNYSMYYEKSEGCEYLVSLGLMENWQKLDSEVYGVTEKGIEAVKTLLLITRPSNDFDKLSNTF
tara:strand:- start:22927 stop:23451 length:525 start_codon:yes stop_codon:yes gene_type:complete